MAFGNRYRCPNSTRRVVFATLLSVVAAAGCGDKDWGYVTGTVTLGGDAVGPGTVMFEQIDPHNDTRAAVGHFKEDGKYVLKSAGNREGANVGEYQVTIHAGGQEAFGDEQTDPNQAARIPDRYRDSQSSGLTATVEPGNTTINFDLKP